MKKPTEKKIGRPLKAHTGDLRRLSRQELAAMLGVTTHTLGNWLAGGELCENPDRTLDIRKVAAFLTLERRKKAEKAADIEVTGPMSRALERWRRARARMAELDLKERKGQLVPLADIRQELLEKGTRLKRELELIGARFGPECRKAMTAVLDDSLDWSVGGAAADKSPESSAAAPEQVPAAAPLGSEAVHENPVKPDAERKA